MPTMQSIFLAGLATLAVVWHRRRQTRLAYQDLNNVAQLLQFAKRPRFSIFPIVKGYFGGREARCYFNTLGMRWKIVWGFTMKPGVQLRPQPRFMIDYPYLTDRIQRQGDLLVLTIGRSASESFTKSEILSILTELASCARQLEAEDSREQSDPAQTQPGNESESALLASVGGRRPLPHFRRRGSRRTGIDRPNFKPSKVG